MKAFVTGGTGFMGSAVVHELLRQGQEVKALVRQGSDLRNLKNLDIELVTGDITDPESVRSAIRGCSTVYHLAAMVRFWAPKRERNLFYSVNVDGTRNVLSAAASLNVDKIVYTSTISTLGTYGADNPTKEEFAFNLWDMSMDYERSKYSAEFEAFRFAARGVPVVVVLPCAPVGARDIKPNPVGQLILDFLGRKLPGYIDGGGNFIDVDDLAYGHILAAKHGRAGERYILGDQNISTPDLFKALESISGVPGPKFKLPYSAALALATGLEFISDHITNRPPLFTAPLVKFSSTYYYADTSKAKKELGFTPRSNVAQGVVKAIRWFLDNGYIKGSDSTKLSRHVEQFSLAHTAAS